MVKAVNTRTGEILTVRSLEVTTMAWHGEPKRHSEAALKTWRRRKREQKKIKTAK